MPQSKMRTQVVLDMTPAPQEFEWGFENTDEEDFPDDLDDDGSDNE
jgi:hypothetical protein